MNDESYSTCEHGCGKATMSALENPCHYCCADISASHRNVHLHMKQMLSDSGVPILQISWKSTLHHWLWEAYRKSQKMKLKTARTLSVPLWFLCTSSSSIALQAFQISTVAFSLQLLCWSPLSLSRLATKKNLNTSVPVSFRSKDWKVSSWHERCYADENGSARQQMSTRDVIVIMKSRSIQDVSWGMASRLWMKNKMWQKQEHIRTPIHQVTSLISLTQFIGQENKENGHDLSFFRMSDSWGSSPSGSETAKILKNHENYCMMTANLSVANLS